MLEQTYDNEADIPTGYRHLYTEADGKFTLLQGSQIKTEDDTRKLQESLRKERDSHTDTAGKLKAWEGLGDDTEAIQTKLDRIEELEAAADGKLNDEQIEELVNRRLNREKAPLEREIKKLNDELTSSNESLTGLREADKQRRITDHIREHATPLSEGGLTDALVIAPQMFEISEDGIVQTRDGVGVTPGVAADVWLTEMRESKGRDHWFKESKGGGSRGSDGNVGGENPFNPKTWNFDKQMAVYKQNPEKANQLAAQFNIKPGDPKPAEQSAA